MEGILASAIRNFFILAKAQAQIRKLVDHI
jgi:hypothetical protein